MSKYKVQITDSLIARFLTKVRKTETCWFWTGSARRYGQIIVGKRNVDRQVVRAHRLSWLIFRGEIPEGLYVCHKCDNTLCVNPKHLFLGTQQDNMNDMKSKGRQVGWPGESNPNNTKLLRADVNKIRCIYKKRSHIRGTQVKLARQFGVTKEHIHNIVHYKIWVSD